MAIKKALLYLPTYPDAPSVQLLESAAFLAQHTGAALTAVIPELSDDHRTWPTVFGAWTVNVPAMVREVVRISVENAALLDKEVRKTATAFQVAVDIRKVSSQMFPSSQALVGLTRLHDLLILPLPESNDFDRDFIHPAIFDTGRPTLLLPHGPGKRPLQCLNTIAVAWDFGREAARALSDAMPLLMSARKVLVFTVSGEKNLEKAGTIDDLKQLLTAHNLNYEIQDVALQHESIGNAITRHALDGHADMLVMGAYGHSRFREFVLGGATRGIINDPPLPVFLSH